MKYHSQGKEVEVILQIFKGRTGTILDCGMNDAKTFSNSYDLVKLGWSMYGLEPGTVCAKAFDVHKGNPNVHIFNYGIGTKEEKIKFFESAAHVKGGSDYGLVSSTIESETKRWRAAGVQFKEIEIQLVPFDKFWESQGKPKFDVISIDCEGVEFSILQQINLALTQTLALIIEWNGHQDLRNQYGGYCAQFGLYECYKTPENLIFTTKNGIQSLRHPFSQHIRRLKGRT